MRLKAQLEGEGLFDRAANALPLQPRGIGLITSLGQLPCTMW